VDLMSEVIRTVRVGSANGRLIGQPDSQGLRLPAISGSGFHIVVRGTCWLIREDEEPVALEPGDVVLTSSGGEHGLSHVPCALDGLPPVEMGPMPPTPEPVAFEFLTCCYVLKHGRAPQYLRALPEFIVVPLDYDRHPEMRAVVDLLGADVSGTRMGAGATLPALLDLILVHALRQWHEQHSAEGRPTTDDPAVSAALRRIHDDPRRRWTVGGLSEAVGMPRTAFTRRFTAVVGQSPTSYMTSWRLGRGARLLRATEVPLATIAREVGYSTEFGFSGAFRREYGVSPGRFRRDAPARDAS
jgi:AraC-like DNA-binding protein